MFVKAVERLKLMLKKGNTKVMEIIILKFLIVKKGIMNMNMK